jgi:hypothetical protein
MESTQFASETTAAVSDDGLISEDVDDGSMFRVGGLFVSLGGAGYIFQRHLRNDGAASTEFTGSTQIIIVC